jgi:hypothetical protein
MKRLFKLAGVEGGHPHRWRHTFACELPLSGVSLKWGFRTMPISVPGHADHPFRADFDQLIMIVGTAIAIPRNVFHRAR